MCGQNLLHFSVEGEICHLQLAGPTLPKTQQGCGVPDLTVVKKKKNPLFVYVREKIKNFHNSTVVVTTDDCLKCINSWLHLSSSESSVLQTLQSG